MTSPNMDRTLRRGAAVLVLLVGAALVIAARTARTPPAHVATAPPPQRIISLIPAATEMLYAIGAGPQMVAVSSFDEYPPEARKLPRVGALLDPDLERIFALRPELVVVYETQSDLRQQLERASIPTFVYKHAGLADVTVTITQLGARVGHEADAARVVKDIEDRLADIRRRVASRPRVRTLLVFGRDSMALRGVYASGGRGFLNDMLDVAGGTNVFADVAQQSVQATSELILARRPDAIVELRYGNAVAIDRQKEIGVWQALPSVPAVRSGRITILSDQRIVVPGPRVAEGTELIARALHPDAFTK